MIFLKNKKGFLPYNLEVTSVIVGGLLGDFYAEKRANLTRFSIHASNRNVEYISFLHTFFSERGYCTRKKPPLCVQIGKDNKVYHSIKFRTFSFSSLNFLHDAFYNEKKEKIVPANIYQLLTKQAFAFWFMDGGGKYGSGLKLSTDRFTIQGVILLQKAILYNFKISAKIQHHKKSYVLYFCKNDKENVFNVVKDFIVDSMVYNFK
jgi:hypothetical protein